MKKYRRKIYDIDAIQWTGDNTLDIAAALPGCEVTIKRGELCIGSKERGVFLTAAKTDFIVLEGYLPRGYVPPYRIGEGVFKLMFEEAI